MTRTTERETLAAAQATARARMGWQTLALQAKLGEAVMAGVTAFEAVEPPKTYGEVAQAARAIQGLARAQKAVVDLVPPPAEDKPARVKTAQTSAATTGQGDDAGFVYDFDDGIPFDLEADLGADLEADEEEKAIDRELEAIFAANGLTEVIRERLSAAQKTERRA